MVIAILSVDEKGQYLGRTDRVNESMIGSMTKHWSDMRDEGRITMVTKKMEKCNIINDKRKNVISYSLSKKNP